MENNTDDSQGRRPSIKVVNGEAKPSTGKKRKILLSFATVVLLAGLGTTGYLFTQEKANTKQLSTQAEDLNDEVKSLKQEAAEKAEVAEAQEAAQTIFKAEVGKFTLTLPSEYYVVEEIDGGYEGGPITQANIGFPTDEENVVSTDFSKTVEISARPSEQKNFESDVENAVGKDAKKVKSVKVDGADADMYDVPGLSASRSVVFNNNDIFYEISSTVQNKNTDKLMDEVISGFKFN